jgi:hypothetical protein
MAPLEIVPSFPPVAAPSGIVIALMWWLLFRLMFSSGLTKLRSGDATWRKLTALCHHYETQPLPTPVAWYAHHLPVCFHKTATVLMLLIEVLVPFFIFGPPWLRYLSSALFVLLMGLIQLTGNYCFFNLLGIALSLLLLDDKALLPAFGWLFPGTALPLHLAPPALGLEPVIIAVTAIIVVLSLRTVFRLFRFEFDWPGPLETIVEFFDALRLVNSYGLFSVMTTERPEIVIEGSHDGIQWHEYQFKWKPGDILRAPRFVAPHQPRLDWQLWFAALGYYKNHPWFRRFLRRLLQGAPEVLSLLRTNPFAGTTPRFVRGVLYDYRFTTQAERRAGGRWWKREWRGLYSPVLGIDDKG